MCIIYNLGRKDVVIVCRIKSSTLKVKLSMKILQNKFSTFYRKIAYRTLRLLKTLFPNSF